MKFSSLNLAKNILFALVLLAPFAAGADCTLVIEEADTFIWNERTTYRDLFGNDKEELKSLMEKKGYTVILEKDLSEEERRWTQKNWDYVLQVDVGQLPVMLPHQVRVHFMKLNNRRLEWLDIKDIYTYKKSQKSLAKVALRFVDEVVGACDSNL